MQISGWGRYPVLEATSVAFADERSLANSLKTMHIVIASGNGRSYGDSALAPCFLPCRSRDRILDFDPTTGLLTCESGILLSEIIETFLPMGWFLKVTPGTKLITIGGAIAADVHGKNHHVEGCFGDTVKSLTLMLADGETVHCSREQNPELFHATCGGMGLTGIILQVSFYLQKIPSSLIEQKTIKTEGLKETFDAFEYYADWPYSVAWIDCLTKGKSLGRSVLFVGQFSPGGNLDYNPHRPITVPCNLPGFILNRFSARAFNSLYYATANSQKSTSYARVDSFFYPLDLFKQWNRIYGSKGFVQYQFILPKESSPDGLQEIVDRISRSDLGSFLAVLKLHGPANQNYLSFPMKGYSLALDFKIQPGLFFFLEDLDKIVLRYGGRIYLAKDARVDRETFEQGYPQVTKFRSLRATLGLNKKFNSLQSQRLGL